MEKTKDLPIEKVYSEDWRKWVEPTVPEYFNPMDVLFLKHRETNIWDKTALSVDGVHYSYKQFYDKVCQTADILNSLGMEVEDRILLFGTDSAEYLSVWLGAIASGVIPAVVSDLYKSENLLYFLKDTAAKALFIDEEQLTKLEDIRSELPETLKYVIIRTETNLNQTLSIDKLKIFQYNQLCENAETNFTPVQRHHNDMAYMFYSGGTTGPAKGIIHVMHDFYYVPERQGAFWEYSKDDICLATSKKYFTHGLWPGVLMPLYYGGTSVISRKPFKTEELIQIVEQEKPTVLITVPTIVKNLLQYVKDSGQTPDFSSLRMAVTASEKAPLEMFDEFYNLFGVELFDSIGSSEITYEWIANRPKEFKRGSLGKPIFGIEIKLVNDKGEMITEPNVTGEAWVKSETASLFYWRKFKETKGTFVGEWTRTKDMLRFDEDGFFWFASRSDDQFKVKGLWVSPLEIEAKITELPFVLEAAVVPYQSEEGMTEVRAYVVLRPGHQVSEELNEQIRNNVRKIGGYKVPKSIVYVDSLPRTTLLKIDRKALRNLAQ